MTAITQPAQGSAAGAADDAIDLEILRHKLHAIAAEMGVPLAKTASSPEISEERDFATSLVDRQGGLVAVDNALHLGALARTAAGVLGYFKFDMKDGDVVLVSDPYRGGTHVQDFTLVRPYVADNAIVLYLVARAHVPDFAGQVAGSYFPTARELWAEGAPLSPIKIHRYDRPVRDVLTTVLLNSRQPDAVRQALDAMLAALELGRRRVDELIDGYGLARLRAAMAYSQDYCERRTRAEIARWSDGDYAGEATLDQDPASGEPVVVRVDATVAGEELTLDFSRSDDQCVSFVNSPLSNTEGFALVPVLSLLGEDVWPNSGVLRAVAVRSREGAVTNPTFPSPVGWCTVHCGAEVAEATARALRPAAEAPFGTLTVPQSMVFCRPLSDRDTRIDLACWGFGGASAGEQTDGWGRPGPLSRSVVPSVERWETANGIRVRALELVEDSAGAGRLRGAPAAEAVIELPDDHVYTLCVEGRTAVAQGTDGGADGAPAEVTVEQADGSREAAPAVLVEQPLPGRLLRLRLGGGGGHGDPREREPEAVLADVLDGLLSAAEAERSYKVVLADGGAAVDVDATAAARREGE